MKQSPAPQGPRYSQAQATIWLSWLAKSLQRHNQTVFLIEGLQVSWLPKKTERIAYWILPILLVGLFVGAITGLFGGLVYREVDGLFDGMLVGLFFGLIFSIGKKNNQITTLNSTFWSWRNLNKTYKSGLKKGALIGVVFGPFAGLFVGVTNGWVDGLNDMLKVGLGFGLFGGFVGGLIALVISGWKTEIPRSTTKPNEGIKLTLNSSSKGLILGLILGLISGLISGLIYKLSVGNNYDQTQTPVSGFIGGLYGSVLGALWLGGMSVIRHYTLRFLIYRKGYGPRDYTDFLNYAVDDLQFMQRVGGGYIFIHRMLLEHFAAMEGEKAPASVILNE